MGFQAHFNKEFNYIDIGAKLRRRKLNCPTKTVIKLRTVQRSELALKLKPMLAAQAKERQKIYCGNQYDKKSGLPQNSAEQKGETREDIAKIAGVSNNFLRSNHFVYDDIT